MAFQNWLMYKPVVRIDLMEPWIQPLCTTRSLSCAHRLFSHPGLLFDWRHQSKRDENGWNHTEINLSFTLRETWSKHSLKGTFNWRSTHLFICLFYSEVWGDSLELCFIKMRPDKVSWMLFYVSSPSFNFFFKEEKDLSKLQRETVCVDAAGRPRGNQYSSHLLHNIKHASRLRTETKTPTQTPPMHMEPETHAHLHTHINTINRTHIFKKLCWNKLQPLEQAGGGQRTSNRWLKLDKRLGDVITWLQVNQRGAIWAPCPDSR